MTSGPAHEDPHSPGSTPGAGSAPDTTAPPKPGQPRPVQTSSDAEGTEADDTQILPETDAAARIWPRVVGVLILLLGAGGAWIWQNPGIVQKSLGSLFPGTARPDANAVAIEALQARVTRFSNSPVLYRQTPVAELAARVDALEKRGQATGQATSQPPVDLRPLLGAVGCA